MGTRGFLCFVADGTEKITYNHFDSNPTDLGVIVLSWLLETDHAEAAAAARRLRMVDHDDKPTRDDATRLGWSDDKAPRDMYDLLSHTGGDPAAILAAGMATDWADFPMTDACCWGYVVDFDARLLEVYSAYGGERRRGRFVGRRAFVEWARAWPLAHLPTVDEFAAQFRRMYGDLA